MKRYCVNCGAKLGEGNNFCARCGNKVAAEPNANSTNGQKSSGNKSNYSQPVNDGSKEEDIGRVDIQENYSAAIENTTVLFENAFVPDQQYKAVLGTSKVRLVPPSVSKEDVSKAFMDIFVQDKDTPVDIAWQIRNYEIETLLYPVRCFHLASSAKWTATSIWRHDEAYVEYEPKTIYIDYLGREHEHTGYDVFDDKGHYLFTERLESVGSAVVSGLIAERRRQFTPQQRMEPVTRYKTVTDDVQDTFGEVFDMESLELIVSAGNGRQEKFANWIKANSLQKYYKNSREAGNELHGFRVIPPAKSNNKAQNIAVDNAEKKVREKCWKDVPGDAAKNFEVEKIHTICKDLEVLLIPCYRVAYFYQGKNYEYWFNGVLNAQPFHEARPEFTYQAATPEADKRLLMAKEKRERSNRVFLGVSFGSLAVGFGLSIGLTSAIPALISMGIVGVVLLLIFRAKREYEEQERECQTRKETKKADLQKKKAAVAKIMMRGDITEGEKEKMIEQLQKE